MKKAVAATAPAVTYLYEQNCEGGTTPTGWTDDSTPNWNYTTTVLQGTKSLYLSYTGSTYTFAAMDTVYAYLQCYIKQWPTSSNRNLLKVANATDAAMVETYVQTATGKITFDGVTFSTGNMAINTKYHVWLTYARNGTGTFAWSTDGVRPTTGDNFLSKSIGNYAAVILKVGPTSTMQVVMDRILLNATQIGDNP